MAVEQETADQDNAPSSLEVDEEDSEQECVQRRLRTMLDLSCRARLRFSCTDSHTCRTGNGARIVCKAEVRKWTTGARKEPKKRFCLSTVTTPTETGNFWPSNSGGVHPFFYTLLGTLISPLVCFFVVFAEGVCVIHSAVRCLKRIPRPHQLMK